jgi:hypothetical protein
MVYGIDFRVKRLWFGVEGLGFNLDTSLGSTVHVPVTGFIAPFSAATVSL